MKVDLPRPRSRKALLEHPKYYEYREELLTFLKEYESGASRRRKRPPRPRHRRRAIDRLTWW